MTVEADIDLSAEPDLPPIGGGGGGRKKLIVLGTLVLLLLAAVGLAFAFGLPQKLLGGAKPAETHHEEKGPPKQAVFVDLPDLLVNINGGGKKTSFLKISVSLELEQQTDVPKVQAVMPRIIDNFQVYLRELRPEDLKGSAGIYRLREELLARVNNAIAPAKVNDVLFKEMLVQ
jgi:flagellar FliL protein